MPTHKDTKSILVESTAEQATEEAAKLFKTIACEAVSQWGICHVALAGGTTPHALYESLANAAVTGEVPWSELVVFFGDERDVPHDHIESNYNMVQRTMLDHLPIAPTSVHAMRADAEDLPAAAAEYERTIRQVLQAAPDEIPKFDLILLGMGGEGHTASLFPDTDILTEQDKLVAAAFIPVLGRWRMTFTLPLINAARNVILLVTGRDKADAVARLLSDEPADKKHLPAAGIDPVDGKFFVVLDEDASHMAGIRHR